MQKRPSLRHVSREKYVNDTFIKWDNIEFPVGNDEIELFEEQNKHISVNVYYINPDTNSKTIALYKRSNNPQAQHKIDLITLDEGNKSHYVFIKNYDKLMRTQTNKKHIRKKHCRFCSHGFQSEELLKKHEEQGCLAVEGQKIEMPKAGETTAFKNHFKKLKAPFVIYGDFECLTVPIDVKCKSAKAKTTSYQNHRPCGFMINVVNAITGSSEPYLYRGEDCMDKFVEKINEVREGIVNRMKEVKEMIMTEKDKEDFENATNCFICGNVFKPEDKKVRDHCHFTGAYRGCTHDDCNLDFRYSDRNPYVKADEDLDLLTDKGMDPYDYFGDFGRFKERALPPKEAIYSKLSEEPVSDKDYEGALKVWKHFGIRTLGQYHDLYLRTDVSLLTDVFENFRDLCMEYYGLDPAHYYTLPNFAWDAMLLKTGVEIEQLHDQEMFEMVEKGMRGGMCQVSHKLSKK